MIDWIKGGPARALAAILLAQSVAYYAAAYRKDASPAMAPLGTFPRTSGGWATIQERPLEKEIQDVLRADDTLNRIYIDRSRSATASLFIAFFNNQRYGQTPHSPKNCLPGSGWEAVADEKLTVGVPELPTPMTVNKYIVARGGAESVLLYWYQSHGRIIAGELPARFWLVSDAIRFGRTDTALVRIVVPVAAANRAAAEDTAVMFLKAVFPDIARALPR
jgi:EpsI family protein